MGSAAASLAGFAIAGVLTYQIAKEAKLGKEVKQTIKNFDKETKLPKAL